MAEPVKVLLAMGFPRDDVVNALLQTRNDLDAAIDLLSSAAPELERSCDRGASSGRDRDEDMARALQQQEEDEEFALQQQQQDEEFAQRAQREADDEDMAITMQRQMRVNVPAPVARVAPVASEEPSAPRYVRPPHVDDGSSKKQRQNRRKREAEKERKEMLREVGAAQQRPARNL
jgi:hypothetical protein